MTKRYWLSWVQPTDDPRPLTYPPQPPILGWWRTGYDADDNFTLVALVAAESDGEAKSAVREDWPEAEHWRFCDEVPLDWRPSNRFILDDWMRDRIGQEAVKEMEGKG